MNRRQIADIVAMLAIAICLIILWAEDMIEGWNLMLLGFGALAFAMDLMASYEEKR